MSARCCAALELLIIHLTPLKAGKYTREECFLFSSGTHRPRIVTVSFAELPGLLTLTKKQLILASNRRNHLDQPYWMHRTDRDRVGRTSHCMRNMVRSRIYHRQRDLRLMMRHGGQIAELIVEFQHDVTVSRWTVYRKFTDVGMLLVTEMSSCSHRNITILGCAPLGEEKLTKKKLVFFFLQKTPFQQESVLCSHDTEPMYCGVISQWEIKRLGESVLCSCADELLRIGAVSQNEIKSVLISL